MRTKVILLCTLFVTAAVPSAHAQFKNPAKATRNFRNLERIVQNAATRPSGTAALHVHIPAGIIAGNATVLTATKTPQTTTPVSASLEFRQKMRTIPSRPLPQTWISAGGLGFYDNQARLARDVDHFYGGSGVTRKSPDGKTVKLYMLPVEGILYKPVGYSTPIVLNPETDFIIYEVESHTGKLAQNTPEVLHLFDQPAKSGTTEAVFGDFMIPLGQPELTPAPTGNLQHAPIETEPKNFTDNIEPLAPLTPKQVLQANKIRIADLRNNHVNDAVWEAMDSPMVYTSQDRLGRELSDFYHHDQVPQFRKRFSNDIGYVYELPVEGIAYAPEGRKPTILDPEKQVVFYMENIGGQILDRSVLENPLYFGMVTE